MKIWELDQPRVGDIVEFETDAETLVEGRIVGETEDGYIYEFSDSGYTALNEGVEEEPGPQHRIAVKVTDPVTYNDVQKIVRVDASDKQDALDQVEAFYAKKGIYIVNIKYLGMVGQQGVAEGGLNEFAPGAGDEGGEDPYKYPKPTRYRRSVDYFSQFEADHFDREDFDDATGEFNGYWGRTPIAYFKFDNPAKTGSDDPGMGWYYEPESSGHIDNTSATPAVDNSEQRKQQELDMINQFLKSGNRPSPGSQIYNLMKRHGIVEEKTRLDAKCWDGYKKSGTKMKGDTRVNNCVPESAGYIAQNAKEAQDPRFSASMTVDVGTDTMRKQLNTFFPTTAPTDGQEQIREAEYHGREVPLGRPMRGDVKKFKVYVKNKQGKVVKVNFGDPNMRIKKSNPARRKSFRARHNCSTPGPRDKARYWSCRKW